MLRPRNLQEVAQQFLDWNAGNQSSNQEEWLHACNHCAPPRLRCLPTTGPCLRPAIHPDWEGAGPASELLKATSSLVLCCNCRVQALNLLGLPVSSSCCSLVPGPSYTAWWSFLTHASSPTSTSAAAAPSSTHLPGVTLAPLSSHATTAVRVSLTAQMGSSLFSFVVPKYLAHPLLQCSLQNIKGSSS